MSQSNGHSRVCPTRIDGRAALFAHKVTVGQCHDRQRGRYHKCFACVYNNAYVAMHGMPGEGPGTSLEAFPLLAEAVAEAVAETAATTGIPEIPRTAETGEESETAETGQPLGTEEPAEPPAVEAGNGAADPSPREGVETGEIAAS